MSASEEGDLMPMLVVDAMNSAAGWSMLESDGITASTALSVAIDTTLSTPGGDNSSVVLSAGAGAIDHSFRRTLAAAVDLTAFDELRLVIRANRVADQTADRPFFIEIRLGSAALAVNDVGNPWHRRLPVRSAGEWEVVRLSLNDLPNAARNAVSVLDLRVIDIDDPIDLSIDEIIAVRASMLVDIEAALLGRLHQQIDVDGGPVPAELIVAGEALSATLPAIFILPNDVAHAPERSTGAGARCDFTADGYRVRAPPEAYSASYILEARAATRPSQAAIMDFLVLALPPRGELRVAALPLPMEVAPPPALDLQALQDPSTPRQLLHYRVSAWRDTGAIQIVKPTQTVVSQVEWMRPSHG